MPQRVGPVLRQAAPSRAPEVAALEAPGATRVDFSPRGTQMRALARLTQLRPATAAGPRRASALLKAAPAPQVLQGYFPYPHQNEMDAVQRYLSAHSGVLLAEFRRIEADVTTPVNLHDWLADRVGVHMNDIYDWVDGPGAQEAPRKRAHASPPEAHTEPATSSQSSGPVPEARVERPSSPQQAAPPLAQQQPAGAWMTGRVESHQGHLAVRRDPETSFWLVATPGLQVGDAISFFVPAEGAQYAYPAQYWQQAPQQPPAAAAAPPRTVPPPTIALTDAQAWMQRHYRTLGRANAIRIIAATRDGQPSEARELLENWNAAHPYDAARGGDDERIALEDVQWTPGGYQGAVAAPEPQAPTTVAVDMGGGALVHARILNDSGGYHMILEHPTQANLVIRIRRDESATPVATGMANLQRLAEALGRQVRDRIRVPDVRPLPQGYIVERVEGAVDGLAMWRRYVALGGDEGQGDEVERLRGQLTAIRSLILANIRAMRRSQPEPFPDFRPANLGRRGQELIYIDFDQTGEAKDAGTLADHIAEWAGRRFEQDPGGERELDRGFFAWLTEGQLQAPPRVRTFV